MFSASNENQILLALAAIERDPSLSYRRAAKIYNISYSTLRDRYTGRPSRHDVTPKAKNLVDLEEEVIVQYILELDAKGFPPRVTHVQDMADRILRQRDAPRVGKNWASNFIKRQPELRTRFTRRYNHQRAQCEDPTLIRNWFKLVENTIAKYGIDPADIFNFDETGFMMGIIDSAMVVTHTDKRGKPKTTQPGNREWITVIQGVNSQGWAIPPFIVFAGKNHLANWYQDRTIPGNWVISLSSNGWTTNEIGLKWIQHFEKHTQLRKMGGYRLLILDGHDSHHSTDFEFFCRDHNIVTLCMPAHSSHILQPLDVGCFSPLKRAYGGRIDHMIRGGVTHITKADFLPAFNAAFHATFTESNIKAGFRGTGLVPFDPESVISKLDIKLKTPTPPTTASGPAPLWKSKTPQNASEATSQSELIKNRIAMHQNSSPTSILIYIDQFAKGAQKVMHRLALMEEEIAALRETNKALSKRRRAKKTRLRQGGSLSFDYAFGQIDYKSGQIDNGGQIDQNPDLAGSAIWRERRCGQCGKPGHNARTCQQIVETSSESNSA